MSHIEDDPFGSISHDFGIHLDGFDQPTQQQQSQQQQQTNFYKQQQQQQQQQQTNHSQPDNDDSFEVDDDPFGQASLEFNDTQQQYQNQTSQQDQMINFPSAQPTPVRLIQAAFEDICDRQLLYIRGRRAIVTCIDYPLIFWRYIDLETEKQYARRFIEEGQLINVTNDGHALSTHFYQVTLNAHDMGILVSTSEFHRSYQATPTIFQIDVEDRRTAQLQIQQQQQHLQQQHSWDWAEYSNHPDHPSLLDNGDDDDWADFGT